MIMYTKRPDTPSETKRVIRVEDESGTSETRYGKLGEVVLYLKKG